MSQHSSRENTATQRHHRLRRRLRSTLAVGTTALIVASGLFAAAPAMAADRNIDNLRMTVGGSGNPAPAGVLKNGTYMLYCQPQGVFGSPSNVQAMFESLTYLLETNWVVTNLTTGATDAQRIGTQTQYHGVTLGSANGMLPAMGDYTSVYDIEISHSKGAEKSFKVQREQGLSLSIGNHPQDPNGYWEAKLTNHTGIALNVKHSSTKSGLNSVSTSRATVPAYSTVSLGGYRKNLESNVGLYYTTDSGRAGNACDTGGAEFPRTTTSATSTDKAEYFFGESMRLTGVVTPNDASSTYEFPIKKRGTAETVKTPAASARSGAASTNTLTPGVGEYSVAGGFLASAVHHASAANSVDFAVVPETVAISAQPVGINPASQSLIANIAAAHSTTPVAEGTVEVRDGDTLLGTGTVVNGVATISLTTLPSAPTGTLQLTYTGSANYLTATGEVDYQLVGFHTGTFNVTGDWTPGTTDTVEYGAAIAANLAVEDGEGAPASGAYEVRGLAGGALTCDLDAQGHCSFTATPVPGSYTLSPAAADPDTSVNFAPVSFALTVAKAGVSIATDPMFGYTDGTHEITVTPNNGLTTVDEGEVAVSFPDGAGGTTTITVPVVDGVATIDRAQLPRTTETVDISYSGSDLYDEVSAETVSTAITHELGLALDRSNLGGTPEYRLDERATVTATLSTNAEDLENYSVQFLRNGLRFGAAVPIDTETVAASIKDDFADVDAVPNTVNYRVELVRKDENIDIADVSAELSVQAAQTAIDGVATVTGDQVAIELTATSPYASAEFGGAATVTISSEGHSYDAVVALDVQPQTFAALALLDSPAAQATGTATFTGLPAGDYTAAVSFAPSSLLYAPAIADPEGFAITSSGGDDNDGGEDSGGGADSDGDGAAGGSGDSSASGSGDASGRGRSLAATGADIWVPLAGAGAVAAFGLAALLLARGGSRKSS